MRIEEDGFELPPFDWDIWMEGGTGGDAGRTDVKAHTGSYCCYITTPKGENYKKEQITKLFPDLMPLDKPLAKMKIWFQLPPTSGDAYYDELAIGMSYFLGDPLSIHQGILYLRPKGYYPEPYRVIIGTGVESDPHGETEIGEIALAPDVWHSSELVIDTINSKYVSLKINDKSFNVLDYALTYLTNPGLEGAADRTFVPFIWARCAKDWEPNITFYVDDVLVETLTPVLPFNLGSAVVGAGLGAGIGYAIGSNPGAVLGLTLGTTLGTIVIPPLLSTNCIKCGKRFKVTTYGVLVWCPYCGEEQIVEWRG